MCHIQGRTGFLESSFQIIIFQGAQHFTSPDSLSLFNIELFEPAGSLGGHGGLSLGHHIAACVQDSQSAGRIG